MSIEYDITTFNNESLEFIVNWQTFTGSGSGSATPVNFTGYTALLQCRQYAGSPVSLFTVGSFPSS